MPAKFIPPAHETLSDPGTPHETESRRNAPAQLGISVAVVILCVTGPSTAAVRNLTFPGNQDRIMQIDTGDRWTDRAVHEAIGGAFRRLASVECQSLLSDFRDRNGQRLDERLAASGCTAQTYLGQLRYTDGRRRPDCARPRVLAFTSPGHAIIYVCGGFRDRFLMMDRGERDRLEIAVIHEALHSLGLPENPPSSEEITRRVSRSCGGR